MTSALLVLLLLSQAGGADPTPAEGVRRLASNLGAPVGPLGLGVDNAR